MFCHFINRFLTRTRNIVHFGVTLNMLFTYFSYLHTVLCIYVYTVIHNHTHIHIQHTYMPKYRHTHIHTYLYMHTHTYLHISTYLDVYLFAYVYIPLVLTCKHKYINTHTYMHIHTCIQLYIHELSMSYACIKYTYIAYIHICVLVEFCVSFVVTF